MKTFLSSAALVAALAFAVPAAATIPGLSEPLPPPSIDDPGAVADPAGEFFATLAAHCGQAFAGRVVVDRPATPDDPFAGKPLVMHLASCSDDTIRIALHVGDDRSRTWVLSRHGARLRLKHDHRHGDGSADALTMYGGDSVEAGTAGRQQFPADAESVALFARENRPASQTNVWAMEIEPATGFVYELARPDGRLFRLEFDLRAAVLPPPAAWGAGH